MKFGLVQKGPLRRRIVSIEFDVLNAEICTFPSLSVWVNRLKTPKLSKKPSYQDNKQCALGINHSFDGIKNDFSLRNNTPTFETFGAMNILTTAKDNHWIKLSEKLLSFKRCSGHGYQLNFQFLLSDFLKIITKLNKLEHI